MVIAGRKAGERFKKKEKKKDNNTISDRDKELIKIRQDRASQINDARTNTSQSNQRQRPDDKQVGGREAPAGTTEVFRSSETGEPRGVRLPSGEVFLGLSPNQIDSITGATARRAELPQGAAEFGEGTAGAQIKTEEEPLPTAEEINVGAFEAGEPRTGLGSLPDKFEARVTESTVGQAIFGRNVFEEIRNGDFSGLSKITKTMDEQGLNPEDLTDDPSMQAILRLKLNERDIQLLKEGEAQVTNFQQLVEAVPIVGDLSRKFSVLFTAPSSRVDDILSEINEIETFSQRTRESATRSPHLADQYNNVLKQNLERVNELESKIKLLTIQSPILQNSPEEVDKFMREIETAKVTLRNGIDFTGQVMDGVR